MSNCYNETELISRIQKGDESALVIIILEYNSYVANFEEQEA